MEVKKVTSLDDCMHEMTLQIENPDIKTTDSLFIFAMILTGGREGCGKPVHMTVFCDVWDNEKSFRSTRIFAPPLEASLLLTTSHLTGKCPINRCTRPSGPAGESAGAENQKSEIY